MREIAIALNVSGDTANAHIKSIFAKFNVHGRTAVVSEAVRRGFVRLDRNLEQL